MKLKFINGRLYYWSDEWEFWSEVESVTCTLEEYGDETMKPPE